MYDTLYNDENTHQVDPEQIQVFEVRQSHFSEDDNKEYKEEVIPSVFATNWPDGLRGQDLRPKMVDGFGVRYLLDSGSMTSVVKPEPGDRLDPSIRLQAVDGTPFPAFGRREIEIKIGRKLYKISAVIAKVQTPILGWDFIRKYKLDWIWGDFGDLYL